MELPPRNNCRRGINCLIHLHSAAGHAWLLSRLRPFHTIHFPDSIPRFLITHNHNQTYKTEVEILASHFTHLKQTAENSNHTIYQSALVVLPDIFNKRHLHSNIQLAVSLAGFNDLVFFDRSTLAAYKHSINSTELKTYLVFELGDINLEISLLTPLLHVKSSIQDKGCPLYGVLGYKMPRMIGINLAEDWIAMFRFRKACEIAKDELCSGEPTTVLNFGHQGKVLTVNLNVETVVRLNLEFIRQNIYECLNEGRAGEEDVDEIILVGDSTAVPEVRRVIEEVFPGRTLLCDTDIQENAALVAELSSDDSTKFMPLIDIFNVGDFFFC